MSGSTTFRCGGGRGRTPAAAPRSSAGCRAGVSTRQSGPAVLPEQLPAAAAGHQHRAVPVHAGEGDQPAAAAGDQRRDQAALGAQGHPVRGVLHIAAGDDPAVVDQRGGAHRIVGVRARTRGAASPGPRRAGPSQSIDTFRTVCRRRRAVGPGRPSPATAMMVATYGRINRNWLGIGVLRVCSCEAIWVTKPKNRHIIGGQHRVPAAHDHARPAR